MASVALSEWQGRRSAELNEIESAHAAMGGTGPGRRYATQQLNHAYEMLLSSHFQGFCRDLHSAAADSLVHAQPSSIQFVFSLNLMFGRQLDRGNAHAASLGSDFGRLGMRLWEEFRDADAHTGSRRQKLDSMNSWRNAIAHQDFSRVGGTLRLRRIRGWRSALNGLASTLDVVVGKHVSILVGTPPW